MTTFFRLGAVTLALLLLIACSSDDSPTDPGGGTGVDTVTVTPVVTQAGPSGWIEVSGLPAGNENVYGVVKPVGSPAPSDGRHRSDFVAATSDSGFTMIIVTDTGTFFMMPFNPADLINGGTVEVYFTDDSSVLSNPITLTIDSLPPAPGEFAAVTDLLDTLFDQQLRLLGTSRRELAALPATQVPLALLPAFVGYDALANPGNPNNLRRQLDGTAPALSGATADMDLLDRLVARMGYRDYLTDYTAAIDTIETPTQLPTLERMQRVGGLVSANGQICISAPDLGITDCASLAEAMRTQTQLEVAKRSAREKLQGDIAANSLLLLSLVPGGGTVSTVVGTGIWIDATIAEARLNLYPSAFEDNATTWNPSELAFPEDFTQPGTWTEFNVTATSRGYSLDKFIVETVLNALGARGAFGQTGGRPPSMDEYIDNLDQTLGGAAKGMATGQAVNQLGGNDGIIDICANIWSNINCADDAYSDVTVLSGSATVDETNRTYEPAALGQANLRIETNEAMGEQSTGISQLIETKEIEVFLDPFQAEADTLEDITFSVRVENAEDKGMIFSYSNGSILEYTDEMVKVKTPVAPWDPPGVVSAFSTSTGGLRNGSQEARGDSVFITYTGIGQAFIDPPSICLKPGENQDFVVSLLNGEIDSVRWSLDPPDFGTLSESGGTTANYRAPTNDSTVGTATIEAVVNGSRRAYSYVSVNQCACAWTADVSGAATLDLSGGWATAQSLGGLWVNMWPDSNQGLPWVSFVCYDATEPGVYPLDALAVIINDSTDWAMFDTTVVAPTLVLEAYERTVYPEGEFADFVQGSVNGVISRLTPTEPPEFEYVTVSITFRAEFFNISRPQCVDD